jgi:hypothetical protein
MTLPTSIVGFSLFGLAARFGQLVIQKRPFLHSTHWQNTPLPLQRAQDPLGHVIAMGMFGFAGYWAHQWDERSQVLLAEKRAQITERRQRQIAKAAAAEPD